MSHIYIEEIIEVESIVHVSPFLSATYIDMEKWE